MAAGGAAKIRGSLSAAPDSLKPEARFRFEKDVSAESAGAFAREGPASGRVRSDCVRGDTRHSAE